MLLSGLIHGHTVVLQVLALGRVMVTLGVVGASVWFPDTCPEDDRLHGPIPGYRDAIKLLRRIGVPVDAVEAESFPSVINGQQGTWMLWPRPDDVEHLPGGDLYRSSWMSCPESGYSMRVTAVDNDGSTLPEYECYVAFITEEASKAAALI